MTAPEHAGARAGLRAASVAVAEFELAAGSPQAALDVLAELEGPPPELAGRAEAAAAAARARQAKLEALRHDYDETVGARTRTFLALILGVVFTTSPLLGAAYPQAVATPRLGGEITFERGGQRKQFEVVTGAVMQALGIGHQHGGAGFGKARR